jgi:hypothetical protein
MKDFFREAVQPETVRTAARVALIVGTVLALINHYDLLLDAPFTLKTGFQIGLSYLVPYCVSTHGQVSARKRER